MLEKLDGCLEAKEPPNSGDCERVCSGGAQPPPAPIACQPASNGDASPKELLVERNGGIGTIAKEPTSDCAKRTQPTSIQFVRSDSVDSRTEEVNGMKDRDDISVKSRSMSLTSSCSLSITITNDGKIDC